MTTSTLTDKGQTTVPLEVRKALGIKPRQQLQWTLREDGTAIVQPQASAVGLFGSLPLPPGSFPGRKKEREQTRRAIARQAATRGR
jgi:bifunctional DNA-binding transcriptional regulator/antitoxin component of YhaV-PrlF toxin-antitoxin module